ncbi:MAG: peptidylprolyl isomerase [Desulfosarcinaceae bacterium]
MAYEKSDYKEDVDRPVAVFETNMGTFEAELYAKECPETVWNFINLAEGRQETARGGNYYDGLSFHRIIDGFVIQGGCPFGNGTGGPGYRFKDEFDPNLRQPHLVTDGLDVVQKIGKLKTGPMDKPVEDIIMEKVTIRR